MSFQLNTKTLEEETCYTGAELRPHWVSEKTGEYGSGLVAFSGATEVPTEELVDLEDKRASDFIRAKSMLHFLAEFFEENLTWAVAQQRLFASVVVDQLREQFSAKANFERRGDDIYAQTIGEDKLRKLSVSIVTGSPVSNLMHFGINLESEGAPVDAIGLREFAEVGFDWKELASKISEKFRSELEGQWRARTKVLPR